jgi:predicted metal-binding membrane protein
MLGALSLAAILALALGVGRTLSPGLCGGGPTMLAVTELGAVVAPWGLALGWLLMLAAMTPPVLIAPMRHLWDRSFAARRGSAIGLFTAGYVAVWTAAGAPILLLVLAAKVAVPAPAAWGAALALLWQISPAKQACLNRCHRRPALAAFGPAAARDAMAYGATHGAWCVGACWPLMLTMLVLDRGQLPVMAAIGLFLAAERLERPAPLAWRWRGAGRATRMLTSASRRWAISISGPRRSDHE